METYVANYPNIGYVGSVCTDMELYAIKNEIAEIQSDFGSHDTAEHGHAGNLQKEYVLKKSRKALQNIVLPLVETFKEHNKLFKCEDRELELKHAWVNYQSKHEYFAPHTHKGLFSFALWIQVPFTLEQEYAHLRKHGKQIDTVSSFVFHYTSTYGQIIPHTIRVDKEYENQIILFPGNTVHSVQPFYSSDEYRITVSGNIDYKED